MIMMHLLDRAAVARALLSISNEYAGTQCALIKRDQVGKYKYDGVEAAGAEAGTTQQPTRKAPIVGGKRSSKTTNTERKLADLEQAVVDGLLTPREAYDAFGTKPPRSGGRARAPGQEDFRVWLRRRVAALSDPDALAKIAEQVVRVRLDRSLSHGQRSAMVRELNRRSWQHDPDYVERLRTALRELDD